MDEIAVLIPCYNEERTIGKVVRDFKEVLPDAVIYVYDNNSVDKTVKIAKEAGAIVRHAYNQGKGNVVRKMFQEVDAQIYIMVDGDDTYPAEAATGLIEMIKEKDADMVIGDRLSTTYYSENKRAFHGFGNRIVRKSINHIFHTNINDIMTGYRAFSYRFVKTFPVLARGFEIETEMSVHAVTRNMRIEQVEIQYRDRPDGSHSKLSTIPDGIKVLKSILKLYQNYKPLSFFGVIGIFCALLGFAFMNLSLKYCRGELWIEYLVVGIFLMILFIISIFTGIILQSIEYKNKQNFEMYIQEVMKEKKDYETNKNTCYQPVMPAPKREGL